MYSLYRLKTTSSTPTLPFNLNQTTLSLLAALPSCTEPCAFATFTTTVIRLLLLLLLAVVTPQPTARCAHCQQQHLHMYSIPEAMHTAYDSMQLRNCMQSSLLPSLLTHLKSTLQHSKLLSTAC